MSYYESVYAAELPARAVTVWLYLNNRANRERQCWSGINTIARDLHLSRRTVERALRDLEAEGFLKSEPRWRENGGQTSFLFTLTG